MNIQTEAQGGSSFSRLSSPPPSSALRNRQLLRLSAAAVAVLLLVLIGSIWATNRGRQATDAFNAAMDAYDAPIQQPGDRPIPNVKTYPSVSARATVANPLFRAAADKYGLFKAGQNARYFAGLTAEDMGNTQAAEADLKKAADARDSGLAALSKMALAGLYTSTNRSAQATQLYEDLMAHPTVTVSANAARLALAGTLAATNPQKARELYATVKDTDKTTVAGQIATQKLNGK